MKSIYLDRYAWGSEVFPDYQPDPALGIVVVLPAYKEDQIIEALSVLNNCTSPACSVTILVVVNESVDEEAANMVVNKKCYQQALSFNSQFDLLVTYQKLPHKKAGVGLARKLGMDEAVRMFRKTGNDGAIVCYDADCTCEENYLVEIESAYLDEKVNAGIVFYEHRLHGTNDDQIRKYELYLRYYIDALRFTKFPYAFQTLGSCITVRSSIYEKVGGMNTRQAGEDFYFLNKTIPHGGFVEINTTTIRPSDRVSDRVPFGTGAAVHNMKEDQTEYAVYHPNIFEDLKLFFDQIEQFWNEDKWVIPKSIQAFLGTEWADEIAAIKTKVATQNAFEKRFFHWFDAFKILKFVHATRDEFYPNVSLEEALEWLSEKTYLIKGSLNSHLIQLRYHDRAYQHE